LSSLKGNRNRQACVWRAENSIWGFLNPVKDESVGQSVKLLLVLASTGIPGVSFLEIRGQDFCALLDMCVFRNGASSSTREESIFLCRRYFCCAVVSARVYPPVMASRWLWTLRTRCHCTVLSNIYTRYTEVFCQCRLVRQVMP
jgi:hypothetical protein